MNNKELADLYESYEKIYEKVDRTKPRPTFMPKSREENIGDQNVKTWRQPEYEPNWGYTPPKRKTNREAMKARLGFVVGTQRRQDKEAGLRDSIEYVLDYLIDEGYADSYESALVILETMTDEWFEDLIEKFNPEDYKEFHQKDHRDDRLDDNDEDQWDREYKEYQRELAQRDRQRDVGRRKRAISATIKERQRRARR